jgi:hypothetical protein
MDAKYGSIKTKVSLRLIQAIIYPLTVSTAGENGVQCFNFVLVSCIQSDLVVNNDMVSSVMIAED